MMRTIAIVLCGLLVLALVLIGCLLWAVAWAWRWRQSARADYRNWCAQWDLQP